MGDAIDNFIADIPAKQRKWELHTVDPFAKAWIGAFENFKAKIKEQQDSDAAAVAMAFNLAMLALSLCGGGLLTAAFGTAASKTLATNAALDIICRNNMERAFKAANFVATNKTASFIAGKVWDEAESKITDAITGKLKESFSQNQASYPSIGKFRTELDMYIALNGFVKSAAEKVNDIAINVRDNTKINKNDKYDTIDDLTSGKFWNPGEKSVDDGTLADDIELSMYMNLILESDSVWTYQTASRSISDGMGHGVEYYYKRNEVSKIEESGSSPNYPRTYSGSGGNQEIIYERIGGIIQSRMNELHKKKFGGKFRDGGRLDDGLSILEAERRLGMLASTNIKKLIEGTGTAGLQRHVLR